MRLARLSKGLLVAAAGIMLSDVRDAAAQTLAIRAGHIVDPGRGTVSDNQIILVRDGKIVDVGPSLAVPRDAQVVDLTDLWVLPGLMDGHTHLTFSTDESTAAYYLRESSGLRALRGAANARSVLDAGFTTVRDVGNDANYVSLDLRNAIRQGLIPGPTIISSGKIIAPFGGQTRNLTPEQGQFWQFEYIDADTPDELRKAVRQNLYYGVDLIKLVADQYRYFYSQEEITAAVTEAHRAGVAVAVHVQGGDAARNTILGGADSIEHGSGLSDELFQLMKEKGTVLVTTSTPATQHEANAQLRIDALRRAYTSGVTLVFGTDVLSEFSGLTRGQAMLEFLDSWHAAGVPPTAILKAMTTNAAALLRIEKERGSLSPGLAADIVAASSNPLEDIYALKKLEFVMKDGVIVRQAQPPGSGPR